MQRLTAISLFASSGIGDLALRASGADVLVANEYLNDRAELFQVNYPDAYMIAGDIRMVSDEIIEQTKLRLMNRNLDVLFATPPCQGMSKNGRGKLLRGIRDGLRDAIDPRNQLATYVPPIVKALNPKIVVFENVPEMLSTLVENTNGELVDLVPYLANQMENYLATWKVVEFADYGVPQRRQRLITVFVRKDLWKGKAQTLQDIFPNATHSSKPSLFQEKWISIDEVIRDLPELDAKDRVSSKSDVPFHYVPVLDEKKYWWVSNTPIGDSAFNNQCVNPSCLFQENPSHSATRSADGINQSRKDTPINCIKCGSLLPRPSVFEHGRERIMKGFTSAYKRMRADLPASALTTNLSYVMSDQKIHPFQNRALSLLEAMRIHTITDYEFIWQKIDGNQVSDKLIRDSIGESVPPRGLQVIFESIFKSVLAFEGIEETTKSA